MHCVPFQFKFWCVKTPPPWRCDPIGRLGCLKFNLNRSKLYLSLLSKLFWASKKLWAKIQSRFLFEFPIISFESKILLIPRERPGCPSAKPSLERDPLISLINGLYHTLCIIQPVIHALYKLSVAISWKQRIAWSSVTCSSIHNLIVTSHHLSRALPLIDWW